MADYSHAQIKQALQLEAIEAIEMGEPAIMVSTPKWGVPSSALRDLLFDAFEAGDDQLLPALIKVWAQALKSADPELRLPAQAALLDFSNRHAERHCDAAIEAYEISQRAAQ